jgi:2,4-dienoyl-CoA reductase-like NADH-dependent reductase (Old Yellow Enzyme family)
MALLREIELHLRATEGSAAKFGRMAMRDPRFVFDLRKGREPGVRTTKRVREYLEACK